MDPDGTDAVLLRGAEGNCSSHWSPDGSRLVFVAGPEGQRDTVVADADGTGEIDLTHSPTTNDQNPFWTSAPPGTAVGRASWGHVRTHGGQHSP